MDSLYEIFPDTYNDLLINHCSSEYLIFELKATNFCHIDFLRIGLKEENFFRCGMVALLKDLYFMLENKEKNIKLFLKNNPEKAKIVKN